MPALGHALPRPGPRHGPYPQRQVPHAALWLALADRAGEALTRWPRGLAGREEPFLAAVAAAAPEADADLLALSRTLRAELARHGLTDPLMARALALAAAAARAAGGPAPHRAQWLAARAMLRGRLVEMDTGEGKSLALLLAAAAAALGGAPVHLVTSNDVLAARDAEAGRPVLRRLGLDGGAIQAAMDGTARRAVYALDVAWCTAREIGFDYLRDQLAAVQGGHDPVLRGLNFALVDEADSVLIDHARTPLVIAVRSELALDDALLRGLWQRSATLQRGQDFTLDGHSGQAELAPSALQALQAHLDARPGPAIDPRVGAQTLRQALMVRHHLQRDHHYLVAPGAQGDEIVLVDPSTGRVNPGTQWTRGVHQLVALKEGLAPPPLTRSAEQITLQTLFARYWWLGGTSGTLRESRGELYAFYRRGFTRVAPRQPSLRRHLGTRVATGIPAWLEAIAERARDCRRRGQPLLVGCASVAESARVAAHLDAAGLPCTLLNARHESGEAQAVAAAGRPGAITVTTNLAGRGTHIDIGPEAAAAGGLHAMLCTLNPSRRVDRQFLGRTARQGLPGSTEILLAVNCGAIQQELPAWLGRALPTIAPGNQMLPRTLGVVLQRVLQEVMAWREFRQRWQMVAQDRRVREMLSHARGAV